MGEIMKLTFGFDRHLRDLAMQKATIVNGTKIKMGSFDRYVYDLGCKIIEARYRAKAAGKPYHRLLINFNK